MELTSPGYRSAAAADWFRLFGDVRYRILCLGQGSEEVSSILRAIHNQESFSAERLPDVVAEGQPQQEPDTADREHAVSIPLMPGSFDMICLVGETAGSFDIRSPSTARLVEALKPGGWLCLQVRSRIPAATSRRLGSLAIRLERAGFVGIEALLVYPDFATPLMVMRPNRKLAATFFRQIYQPRTIIDAIRAAAVRLMLNLGAENFAFRHHLVLARKA